MRRKQEIILGLSGVAAVGLAVYFYSRNKAAPANVQSFPAGTTEYLLNPSGTATAPVQAPSTIYNDITTGQNANWTTVTGPGGTNPHNAFVPLANGEIMMYDQYGIPDEITYQQAEHLGYTGPA